MDLETFRTICLSKKLVTEEFPFGEEVMVFKVAGKMFALAGIDNFDRVSLKVDPEEGVELREKYDEVIPAYHMNKKHWVNVMINGRISDKLVAEWTEKSYQLVVMGLPKQLREKITGPGK
jgi:predicted DNA-binding protein (MmcQ/YjbR family)